MKERKVKERKTYTCLALAKRAIESNDLARTADSGKASGSVGTLE